MYTLFYSFLSILQVLFCVFFLVNGIRKGPSEIFFKPIYLFVAFFALIHFLLPLLQFLNSYFRYQVEYEYSSYLIVSINAFICLALVVISNRIFDYYLIAHNIKNIKISIDFRLVSKADQIFLFLVFAVSSFIIYRNINLILSLGVSEYLKDRIAFSFSSGYLTLIPHWSYVVTVISFTVLVSGAKKYRKLIFTIVFFSSLLLTMVYYSLNSNRNSLFVLGASCILVWFCLSKIKLRKKLFRLGTTIILMGVLFSLIGQLRYQYKNIEPVEGGGLSYKVIKTLNSGFGNNENLLWLYENDFDYQLGSNYMAAFLNIIPRSLWPEKPLGAGPALKNMIYPGSYVLGGDKNSSLTTGLITEAVMNFGWLGAYILSVMCGLVFTLLSVFSLYVRKHSHPYVFASVIIIFFAFSAQILYSEFMGWFSRFLFSLFPLIVWYFLYLIRAAFKIRRYTKCV